MPRNMILHDVYKLIEYGKEIWKKFDFPTDG